jgi:hypothetical protein
MKPIVILNTNVTFDSINKIKNVNKQKSNSFWVAFLFIGLCKNRFFFFSNFNWVLSNFKVVFIVFGPNFVIRDVECNCFAELVKGLFEIRRCANRITIFVNEMRLARAECYYFKIG